ncbi:MAG: fibronectin type III domain-containing protein, partial [Reichenbachiella sp.]|uniref:fibronectin type III domain-containing protein n=1 Tax=Reichenbachiella sp. TaxID=2184521 RepID=UPI00326306EA
MKNFITTIGIFALLLAGYNQAKSACATPGTFTLNSPSSGNIFGTSINLTWGTSSNSLTYAVNYRKTGTTNWSTKASGGTSTTISSLAYGTTYEIKVISSNFCNNPVPPYDPIVRDRESNTITVTTEASAPTAYSGSSIGTTSFTASWTSRTGATSYKLDVSTSSIFISFVSGYNGLSLTGTSRTVSGLSSATRYYYRVRAVNSGGESANSGSKIVNTIPETPVINNASSVTQSSFVASWGTVTRADSYRLDVSTSPIFITYVSGYQNLSVTGTSRTVSGLSSGVKYYFRVRAYDTSGSTTSSNSSVKNTTTIPSNPVASAATSMTQTSFVANWAAVTGAANYRLDISETDDFSTYLTGYQNLNVSGTSRSISGLSEGITYYYRLRAENGTGISSNSNEISAVTIPNEPTSNTATSIAQVSFTANWSAVTGATEYRLDVSESNIFSEYVTGYEDLNVAGTSYSVSGLTPGTTYFYRLRAINNSGNSENSSTIETLTIPAAPTANAASSITKISFVANWSSVTGATQYRLDVSEASDFSSFLTGYEDLSVAGTSQSVTDLATAKQYYYRVRSLNESGTSENSNSINDYTLPQEPVLTASSLMTQSAFTVNWSTVDRVESYRLDVSENETFSTFVTGYNDATVTGTSHEVSGLATGTTYYARLRAVDTDDSNTSGNSNTESGLTIPAAPVISSASNINRTSFKARWLGATGASSYKLDVSTVANFSIFVDGLENITVFGTSKTINNLEPATTYYYRVKSNNGSGTSENSDIESALTVPEIPVSQSATDYTQAEFVTHWEAVSGADSYLLDVSESDNFSSFVSGYQNLAV